MPQPYDPDTPLPADQKVQHSERLWSDEVGIARAGEVLPARDVAYEWSNGRKFEDGLGPYIP